MIARRKTQWEDLKGNGFDVLIMGGGVSGTCLYHHLCAEGYRVLLVDKGDFGSATSQSSAMMIWGGLLYLKHLRFHSVWGLCGARDRLVREKSGWVKPQVFRYLTRNNGYRGRLLTQAALYLYWALGRCQGARPRHDGRFADLAFLRDGAFRDSFLFQEAALDSSDSRFALHWILANQNSGSVAMNYCSATGATFSETTGNWSVELCDHLDEDRKTRSSARMVINCTGPWTDDVNKQFGIETPFKHVFSKGVFLGLNRFSDHEEPLVMDVGHDGDCMSLIPWGPISLWGPTETYEMELSDALPVQRGDFAFLLKELNRFLPKPKSVEDIVSVRNGVRALVVNKDQAVAPSTLELSRKFKVHSDPGSPWISIYGGKLTDCVRLATTTLAKIKKRIGAARMSEHRVASMTRGPELVKFPGLPTPVPSVKWCVEREMCWTLDDYLRRRTNISQWTPRGGLGRASENRDELIRIAEALPAIGPANAKEAVRAYESRITSQMDRVLAAC